MDLISRISEHFSESAHLKLQSMDALAGPIAEAALKLLASPEARAAQDGALENIVAQFRGYHAATSAADAIEAAARMPS